MVRWSIIPSLTSPIQSQNLGSRFPSATDLRSPERAMLNMATSVKRTRSLRSYKSLIPKKTLENRNYDPNNIFIENILRSL